jgi:mannose-6-phosphate isomerase class I
VEAGDGLARRLMAAGKHFAVEMLTLEPGASWGHADDGRRFCIVTCTAGVATLADASGEVALRAGDSCLVPATMGRYSVSAATEATSVMLSYVPDFETDVVKPLRLAGYDREGARGLVGGLA